ncbi:MAG: hypothetical protein K2M95_07190 [Clostridiales bacterium]|nr:hypothetical protein [Clostridiales bacterium]
MSKETEEQQNREEATALETETQADETSSAVNNVHQEEAASNGHGSAVEPQTSASIWPLAIRTACITFAVLILLFACILNFAPYTAMKFYTKIGNRSMAFYSAEKYIARHENETKNQNPAPFGKFADALYNCNGASIYFFNESLEKNGYAHKDTKYYARKLDKYATMYIGSNLIIDSLAERTTRVDRYNLLHTAPALHPYVYSYADSLQIMRFKADYALRDETVPTWRMGNVVYPQDTTYARYAEDNFFGKIAGWNESSGSWSSEQIENEVENENVFLMFAQLSEYLKAELSAIGYYSIKKACDEPGVPDNQKYAYPTASDVSRAVERDGFSLYNKHPFAYFMERSGALRALYVDITYRLPVFVQYIRDNATKYVDAAVPNALEHLKMTYYLKSLSDFVQNMWNMTAVLSSCTRWFNEENRIALQRTEQTYSELFRVSGVRVTVDGNSQLRSCDLKEWYEWGLLQDYLDFYKPANA